MKICFVYLYDYHTNYCRLVKFLMVWQIILVVPYHSNESCQKWIRNKKNYIHRSTNERNIVFSWQKNILLLYTYAQCVQPYLNKCIMFAFICQWPQSFENYSFHSLFQKHFIEIFRDNCRKKLFICVRYLWHFLVNIWNLQFDARHLQLRRCYQSSLMCILTTFSAPIVCMRFLLFANR